MGMTYYIYLHNSIMSLYYCDCSCINMIYCFIDARYDFH